MSYLGLKKKGVMLMTEEIIMPNEIFEDLKIWVEKNDLNSVLHQEFAYSYYWYITYLWRYAKHAEVDFKQGSIKELLGYNRDEKRIDYIVKRRGVLDSKKYTETDRDFPLNWNVNKKTMNFTMLSDFSEEGKSLILQSLSVNFIVKKPLKHINNDLKQGFLWNPSTNTHTIGHNDFKTCMDDPKLSTAGFYLFAVLTYLKSTTDTFTFTNELLRNITGWSIQRVIDYKNRLIEVGLLHSFLMDASSKGEKRIHDFLISENIKNVPEYSFDGLKGTGDNHLRFDYALFNYNHDLILLIEYDGEHHFKSVDYTGRSEDGGAWYLERTLLHDIAKNRYCNRNRIPLLRIPYWEYENIEKLILNKLNEISKPPCLIEMLLQKSKRQVV